VSNGTIDRALIAAGGARARIDAQLNQGKRHVTGYDNVQRKTISARSTNEMFNGTLAVAFVENSRIMAAQGDAPLVPRSAVNISHFILLQDIDVREFAARLAAFVAHTIARAVGFDTKEARASLCVVLC